MQSLGVLKEPADTADFSLLWGGLGALVEVGEVPQYESRALFDLHSGTKRQMFKCTDRSDTLILIKWEPF